MPRVSVSVGLGLDPQICISSKFAGDADISDAGTTICEQLA